MLRRIVILFIVFAILFSLFSIPVFAYELNESSAIIDAYYLFDIKHNVIMAEKNSDKIISPSSTVKIMTACIILESHLDLNGEIEITEKIIRNVSGRNMELKVGDKLTATDLLYAMICGGFNDATVALALSVSTSLYEFVELMNEKAEQLGMNATRYVNVTGMENELAITTASDLAILTRYMAQNEKFVEICSAKSYRFSDSATCKYSSVNNRSNLLNKYKGLANFNTGSAANGDCVIAYYKTEDFEIISIVMNTRALDDSNMTNFAELYTQDLLSHSINDYETVTVKKASEPIAYLPVKYSISSDEIPIYLKENLTLFLANNVDIDTDLSYIVNINGGELKAPLKNGDEIGTLTVVMNETILASVPVIITTTVERNTFLFAMDMMREFVTSLTFVLILLIIVISIIAYRYSRKNKFRKKKRRRKNKSKIIKK